jgi:hypothetical protein
MPGAQPHPQPRVRNEKAHECRHREYSRNTRHSRTRVVLTVSSALSPVIGLSCHRRKRNAQALSPNLTPASRRQDHTTSPSANSRARRSHESRPPHPVPNVRDDRETPLQGGRDGGRYEVIWVKREGKYFWRCDWTAQITLNRFNKFAVTRKTKRRG